MKIEPVQISQSNPGIAYTSDNIPKSKNYLQELWQDTKFALIHNEPQLWRRSDLYHAPKAFPYQGVLAGHLVCKKAQFIDAVDLKVDLAVNIDSLPNPSATATDTLKFKVEQAGQPIFSLGQGESIETIVLHQYDVNDPTKIVKSEAIPKSRFMRVNPQDGSGDLPGDYFVLDTEYELPKGLYSLEVKHAVKDGFVNHLGKLEFFAGSTDTKHHHYFNRYFLSTDTYDFFPRTLNITLTGKGLESYGVIANGKVEEAASSSDKKTFKIELANYSHCGPYLHIIDRKQYSFLNFEYYQNGIRIPVQIYGTDAKVLVQKRDVILDELSQLAKVYDLTPLTRQPMLAFLYDPNTNPGAYNSMEYHHAFTSRTDDDLIVRHELAHLIYGRSATPHHEMRAGFFDEGGNTFREALRRTAKDKFLGGVLGTIDRKTLHKIMKLRLPGLSFSGYLNRQPHRQIYEEAAALLARINTAFFGDRLESVLAKFLETYDNQVFTDRDLRNFLVTSAPWRNRRKLAYYFDSVVYSGRYPTDLGDWEQTSSNSYKVTNVSGRFTFYNDSCAKQKIYNIDTSFRGEAIVQVQWPKNKTYEAYYESYGMSVRWDEGNDPMADEKAGQMYLAFRAAVDNEGKPIDTRPAIYGRRKAGTTAPSYGYAPKEHNHKPNEGYHWMRVVMELDEQNRRILQFYHAQTESPVAPSADDLVWKRDWTNFYEPKEKMNDIVLDNNVPLTLNLMANSGNPNVVLGEVDFNNVSLTAYSQAKPRPKLAQTVIQQQQTITEKYAKSPDDVERMLPP